MSLTLREILELKDCSLIIKSQGYFIDLMKYLFDKVKGFHPVCEVLRRLHGLPDTNLQQSKTSEGKPEKEYSCRNITLKQDLSFGVTVIHFKGFTDRITIKPTIPKNYKKLLEEILRQKQPYTARVVVDGFGERKSRFWLHGEIHVTIPYNFYLKVMKRFDKPLGNNVGGVDVNVDRISLAILSRDGEVLDYKTFWFEDASRKNYPRHKAWSLISEKIHEMLKYAYYHGVNTLFVENPEVLGKLKILWMIKGERKNENYNYRVTVFRSSIIYRIVWKAPLYGIKVKTVDPKGTTRSELHDEVMRKYGVDKHTASAIVIAMKGLKLT